MVFDEILPLYFSAPSYAGGLGSNSQELAKALSIAGIQQLYCQFVLYPKMNRMLPTLTLARIAFALFIPAYLLFPELTTFKQWLSSADGTLLHIWTFRAGYMGLLFVRFFGNCLAYTSLMIMVTHLAQKG